MLIPEEIQACFEANRNESNRAYMYEYMRFQFDYYGIKTPLRKKLSKPFLAKAKLLTKSEMMTLVEKLWACPQRELHQLAMDIAIPRFKKEPGEQDISFFEYLARKNAWWDTVDFIASKLMGHYFLVYPDKRQHYIDKWLASDYLWLIRCAILFQLKYKDQTDLPLLFNTIRRTMHTEEFFINKAIGWILRENSKRVPDDIRAFVSQNQKELSPLSKKEALRLITN